MIREDYLCGAGVGITADVLDRVQALVNAHVDVIVVDSAHGHSANVLRVSKNGQRQIPRSSGDRR